MMDNSNLAVDNYKEGLASLWKDVEVNKYLREEIIKREGPVKIKDKHLIQEFNSRWHDALIEKDKFKS